MKFRKLCVFGLFLFLLSGFMSSAPADETKPQTYFVVEYVLKPGKIADFEIAWKESLDELRKQDFSLPVYVYAMEFPHYYAFYPVSLYSGIDDLFAAYSDFVKKIEASKLQKIHEREYSAVEYYRMFLTRFREDLSLLPGTPKYQPDQEKFTHWGLCYVQPGKEQLFEESVKALKDMYKQKNLEGVDYGWRMYQGDLGTEMPFYYFSEYGDSKAHFWTQAEKRHEAAGSELFDLFDDVLKACRKFVFKAGQYRPDLSHFPKEK